MEVMLDQHANKLWANYGLDYCFNDFDLNSQKEQCQIKKKLPIWLPETRGGRGNQKGKICTGYQF